MTGWSEGEELREPQLNFGIVVSLTQERWPNQGLHPLQMGPPSPVPMTEPPAAAGTLVRQPIPLHLHSGLRNVRTVLDAELDPVFTFCYEARPSFTLRLATNPVGNYWWRLAYDR